MKKLKLLFFKKRNHKGQSFVEMTIIMMLLVGILFSMVEFGNLLNQYITLVDAAREGARFGSNDDPFAPVPIGKRNFYEKIDYIIEGDVNEVGETTALDPLVLDPAIDDIVISFFSIEQSGHVTRFPSEAGLSKNHTHVSQISSAEVTGKLNGTAPSSGAVLVEIFYRYHQIFTFIPYDINLHTYSIMPLSAAEPTPTPCPTGVTCS